jgi:hypothetical protein
VLLICHAKIPGTAIDAASRTSPVQTAKFALDRIARAHPSGGGAAVAGNGLRGGEYGFTSFVILPSNVMEKGQV